MPSLPTGQFTTHSAEETFEFAYAIGESLRDSTVFLLQGDLGAGKTVFAKGLAAGLDIDPADVNSPTFTLVNRHEGRLPFYHLDLYRLEGAANDLRALGLDEILQERAVVVIEWPERLGGFALPGALAVSIADLGGEERRISLSGRASGMTE